MRRHRLRAPADRLLGVIKRRGPQRIADVAAALAITAEAARQQLGRLAADGLVWHRRPNGAASGGPRSYGISPRPAVGRFPIPTPNSRCG